MGDHGNILAIDVGLSCCKVVLFAADGSVIGVNSGITPVTIPDVGISEIDMQLLWQTVAGLCRKTVRNNPVAAVGVSAHGNGLYSLGTSGSIIGPAISSMDLRAEKDLQLLPDKFRKLLEERSMQNLWAGQPGIILRWLKRHKPEVYSKINKIMLCKDFLSYMLTGKYQTDYSDISASGLFNNITGNYDDEMFAALGISEMSDRLPEVIRSFDVRGGITRHSAVQTGISAGTPVIGGMFDVDACTYGAGVIKPGIIGSIAGTWNVNASVITEPRCPHHVRQCIWRGDGESLLLIGSSATSAVNIDWLLRKFLKSEDGYKVFDNVLVKHRWRAESPFYLPFVNGSLDTNAKKGALLGLNIAHEQCDVIAAVAEGICFAHKFHIENLKASGAEGNCIRLTGGAVTDNFCRLFANICGCPVETINERQSGAAGIRAAAAVALGKYSSMQAALSDTVSVKKFYLPEDSENKLFNQRYKQFKEFIKCPL